MKRILFLTIIIIFNTLLFSSCDETEESYIFNDNDVIENNYCLVDLRGEVMYPGIYKVEVGSLIVDVINLAGGITDNANIDNISLVSSIDSNIKLIIPSKNIETSENTLINLNTATLQQLTTLPKIGDAKAKAIIEYREKTGGFKSIEEIKNISGIGESLYETIKEYITVWCIKE